MRIAVLSRNFSATGGGAERYATSVVAQLLGQHEVHVFTQSLEQPVPGVQYHRVPLPLRRPRWINQLWFALASWWLTRHGFDIVHSHENSWHGNVQTVHVLPVRHTLFDGRHGLARVLRWLKVLTSPRLLVYLGLERLRYAPQARRRVVVTSQSLRDVMARSYAAALPMLEVIAPGVDAAPGHCDEAARLAARRALGLPQHGQGVLFVGNDMRKKGLPALLHALQGLPVGAWLAVVGQGEQNAAMDALVQQAGLGARVHFLGSLRDMPQAYRAADVLAHPTLEDTYAMVVLEALAHGLPVVVSSARYCGISAELQHGVQALLLDNPRDAAELGAALQRVLLDAPLAHRLSRSAQQFAAHRTWAAVGQRHDALFAEVASVCRQRWLVLAHAFNMDGRAASQTITDKLPHLAQAGIEVVVLSGVAGRPDARGEHHQLWPAGPAGLRFELRHVLRKHWGSGLRYRSAMLAASLLLLPFMLLEKILRPVESSWSWWLSAWWRGRRLLRKRHFDLIYSTGGAFAAHIAGAALQRASGVPWLAEVHDPMVVPGSVPQTPQQKMQARVEALICLRADLAIWFTEQALASARRRHAQLAGRGRMMLPGVDRPSDVLQPYAAGDKCVIGHFGSLSPTRNLRSTIAALDALQAQQPDLRGKLELHVYGGPLDSVSAQAASAARFPCLRHFGRIEADPVSGQSGRQQILQRMRSADVLLLLHGEEPICAEYIPSKMYEYFWMLRPIVATVHCNDQMQALLVARGAHVVRTDAVPGTASARPAASAGQVAQGAQMEPAQPAQQVVEAALCAAFAALLAQWAGPCGLADLALPGDTPVYSTGAAVARLVGWVEQLTGPAPAGTLGAADKPIVANRE